METMQRGVVVSVFLDRGYGFIEPCERGADMWFHCSVLADLDFDEQLQGRRVEYEVTVHRHRPRAVNVRAAT